MTLRAPKGSKLRVATVAITHRRRRTIIGRGLHVPIDLTGLPKGKIHVTVTAVLSSGQRLTERRTYRTCAARRH
jgi:hypothetical protein